MANSLGTGSVPQVVLDQTFYGLETEIQSVFDTVGTRIDVPNITGKLPTESSKAGLAQARGGIIEGAAPPVELMEFTTTDYNCFRYVGLAQLPDGVRDSLERSYNYDAIERAARRCRAQACLGFDAYGDTVLKDTAKNAEEAAGNAWTDTTNGTPIDDMQDAFAKCGYGDLVIIGRDVAEALALHPDFTARYANFTGANAATPGEITNQILGWFPNVQNVVIGRNLYNSANPADAVTLAYEFDGLAWVGHSSDVVVTELGSGTAENDRDIIRETEVIRYTRRLDLVRPHQEMGCVISGVI